MQWLWRIRVWSDRLGLLSDPLADPLHQTLDTALQDARSGRAPELEVLRKLDGGVIEYYEALARRHGEKDNRRFPSGDRVRFLLAGMKAAALQLPNHFAWPVLSSLRADCVLPLSGRVGVGQTGFPQACLVMAALHAGNLRVAERSYAGLSADPWLAELARRWVWQAAIGYTEHHPEGILDRFLARQPRWEPWQETGGLASRARFALLLAAGPEVSSDPRHTVAEVGLAGAMRLRLENWWDIKDRTGASETMKWLEHEGHRASLEATLAGDRPVDDKKERTLLEAHREGLERGRLLAFDLCRLVELVRTCVAVGFLAEEEAWVILHRVADRICERFSSWDELADDFALGCGWVWGDPTPSDPRVAAVRWLQSSPSSPWRGVAFGR